MIDVAVRRLHADAVLPIQAYEGDAGVDLASCEEVRLEPGERAVIPTGIAVEIPEGYAGFGAVSVRKWPRASPKRAPR